MPAISKSLIRALGCERFAKWRSEAGSNEQSSDLALVGTEFHAYRARYVQHLSDSAKAEDRDWALQNAIPENAPDEARALILRDIERFKFPNAALVYATELFLSIDANGTPLRMIPSATPGQSIALPNEAATGVIDLLLFNDDMTQAFISDYKSGWSNKTVRESEARHYAGLVLCHFPTVRLVTFEWEFVRAGAKDALQYTQLDVPKFLETIRHFSAKMEALRLDSNPSCNPFAGLCGYCRVACPLKKAAEAGVRDVEPIQTREQAVAALGNLVAARSYVSALESGVRGWVEENGKLDLPNGQSAEISFPESVEYPAKAVMAALGFEVTGEGKYDIDPDKLRIGSTELKQYAKAKKRAALLPELARIAVSKRQSGRLVVTGESTE